TRCPCLDDTAGDAPAIRSPRSYSILPFSDRLAPHKEACMPSFVIAPATRLNEIGRELVASGAFVAQGEVTHCNEFLSAFAAKAFDYHGLDGKLANAIADFLRQGSDAWKLLFDSATSGDLAGAFASAQDLANQGFFVVAALKTTTAHGHCAAIVSGTL